MTLRFRLTLFFLLVSASFRAAPADSLLLKVPAALLPQLGTIERLTLLNAYANHPAEASVENALEGTSCLTFRSDSLLCLQLSEAATWQMLLLSDGNVAIATTTLLPAPDTRIKLYSPIWQLIADVTPRFSLADFWLDTPTAGNATTEKAASTGIETPPEPVDSLPAWRRGELRSLMRPLYVQATFDRSNLHLVFFSLSIPSATPADTADLRRLLRPAVRYRWEETRLVPAN